MSTADGELDTKIEAALCDVISDHERWAFNSVQSSPADDQFIADLVAAVRLLISTANCE